MGILFWIASVLLFFFFCWVVISVASVLFCTIFFSSFLFYFNKIVIHKKERVGINFIALSLNSDWGLTLLGGLVQADRTDGLTKT